MRFKAIRFCGKATTLFTCAALTMIAAPCAAQVGLEFFHARERDVVSGGELSKYERIDLPGHNLGVVYVERKPAVSIPLSHLSRVVVEKRKIYKDVHEMAKDVVKGRVSAPAAKDKNTCVVAKISFTAEGAKRFKDFARGLSDQLLDVRLNRKRLNVAKFIGPFEGDMIELELLETDIARVKSLFAPLKSKVTWN